MLASPSQTNQNNLLVDSSRPPALSTEEVAEEEAEEEAAEEAEGVTILMMTLTPSPPRLQMGNSMEKNPQYSRETER